MKVTKTETNYLKKTYFKSTEVRVEKYKDKIENKVINIYPGIEYQRFIGFGGAITQAAGFVYQKLPKEKQESFLNDLLNESNYCIFRIPIGSCDFSPEMYSYSYKNDLSDFSVEKDEQYLIPLIKDILRARPEVQFLASPWSPPSFMKNNKILTLGGRLNEKYYELYANYLAKYIKEYEKIGIEIKYITIQNEPNAVQIWESCLFNADEEAKFIKEYLQPVFEKENINTKILIYDHNKEKIFKRAEKVFKKTNAEGIAYHWYTGDHFENLNLCRETYPDKLLIHTEGCVGYSNFKEDEEIKNAEIYAHDILGDLNSGCNGYIDWNILLDNNGGPNHKKNYCNSPIMANKNIDGYYKNLCYYYILHFSKIILPGSTRLAISRYNEKIETISFKNTDGSIGIILLNTSDENFEYNICVEDSVIHDNIDSHTIVNYSIKH